MAEEYELIDVQNREDLRNIPIDRVGVKKIAYPIRVLDRANQYQHTIGDFELTVHLPHHYKGTHLSRFIEVLSEHQQQISVEKIPEILSSLRKKLDSTSSHLKVEFPYFIEKYAPVSKSKGLLEYRCGYSAYSAEEEHLEILVKALVTTVCPCSKEISNYGAHNQRGLVTTLISFNKTVWFEEIIEMIEASASGELYSLLKRSDEKWVTESAYENPRFVEDLVREIAVRFNQDARILSYTIEAENYESIHAHNAYACVKKSAKS